MTQFYDLPSQLQELLIMLPFRVGYYVSASDQTGGEEAEEQELEALSNIVTYYIEDALKSEIAQQAMTEMLGRRKYWDKWREHIDQVPAQCEKLFEELGAYLDDKDLIGFKNNLIDIAIAVAQAYCEDEHGAASEVRETSIAALLKRIGQAIFPQAIFPQAIFSGEPQSEQTISYNISAAEREAILKLADSLQIEVAI